MQGLATGAPGAYNQQDLQRVAANTVEAVEDYYEEHGLATYTHMKASEQGWNMHRQCVSKDYDPASNKCGLPFQC